MTETDRQAADDRHRNRTRSIAAQPARSGGSFYRTGGNTAVTDNPRPLAHDVGTRKAALVFHGALLEPVVQRRVAAVEVGQIVVGGQRLRRRKLRLAGLGVTRHRSQAGARRNNARSFGPGAGGLSRARTKA